MRTGGDGECPWSAVTASARLQLVAVAAMLCSGAATVIAQDSIPPPRVDEEAAVTGVAKGAFDVKLAPLPAAADSADTRLGRMSIEKQFHGDLEGTSRGEMLTAMTAVEGSAGYVAVEKVTGVLAGRRGTFVLQHSGTMDRGRPTLVIAVVPDSGTEELAGITGTMTIEITDGKHFYELAYTVPDSR